MINIALPWPPTVNTYYTVARGRKILSKRGREFKKSAKASLTVQKTPQTQTGRLRVLIDAYPPDKRRRDLDNIVKPIFDLLGDYGVFDDDSQIDDFQVRRKPQKEWSGVRVYITEIED